MQREKNILIEPATQKNRTAELTRNEAQDGAAARAGWRTCVKNRTLLREEWVARIAEAQLLTAMTQEEIFAEATLGLRQLRRGS